MNDLKKIRIKMGWTQTELAIKLSVSQKTISAWERNFRTPSTKKMQQIEDLTNVPKENIFAACFDYKK